MRSIDFSDSIEAFEEWNSKKHVLINGIKTSSIDDLIRQKGSLNRAKDQRDLRILYQHQGGILD
jgi:hypothetical protein